MPFGNDVCKGGYWRPFSVRIVPGTDIRDGTILTFLAYNSPMALIEDNPSGPAPPITALLPISAQSFFEEALNVITHRFGLQAGIAGFVVMTTMASVYGTAAHIVSTAVFCIFLNVMYITSVLYHAAEDERRRQFYRILDHVAIFTMIAGSYTPFMLVLHKYPVGWPLFWTIWAVAILGGIMKLFYTGRFRVLSTLLYLGMGWLGVFAIGPLQESLPGWGFFLLIAGGLSYTIGALFYLWRSLPFNHALWHLFVMAGCTCHYFSVMSVMLVSPSV